MRRFLKTVTPDAAAATVEAADIRAALLSWLLPRPPCTIAAFSPLPGEVDLLALFAEAPGLRWVLPRVENTTLIFHAATLESLRPGAYGIAEPADTSPVVPIGEVAIFLCPGLGFSPAGARLGRGKGFYDRALASASPDAERVGVAFRAQVVSELPLEAHDLPMHWLATAEGVLPCR